MIRTCSVARFDLRERNAMLGTVRAINVNEPMVLADATASADYRAQGMRTFYSVDVIDRRTGATVYTAQGNHSAQIEDVTR